MTHDYITKAEFSNKINLLLRTSKNITKQLNETTKSLKKDIDIMNTTFGDEIININSILKKMESQIEYIERQITSDFYIESSNDDTTITITGLGTGVLSYSKTPSDTSSWVELTISHGSSDDIIINSGERLYLKGNIVTDNSGEEGSITIGSDGPITVGGNVYSIADQNGELSKDYQCYSLFAQCRYLQNAPELPATTLTYRCYREMFQYCASLTTAPELPATTLASSCYEGMFFGCTGLTTAPELPATTLANWCYSSMFYGCTGLTTAPVLPATTLASNCYNSMFMKCTSLTTAPELPATSLADHCYFCMLEGCTSLTTAPALPATTLTDYCYAYMFNGCTSLTTAPDLLATTLTKSCYQGIFRGCSNLLSIKCLATDISAINCTNNWVKNVAATGTFVKDATMTDWTTGANGIPTDWTVINN